MDEDLRRDPPTDTELDSTVSSERLTELRRILVGPETSAIREILAKLENRKFQVDQVSQILPQAIKLRSEQDSQLVPALNKTVEEILTNSVQSNPKMLATVLFPIMGPAIRASIVSTLREMLSSFERTLNHSLSPKSISWRIEAYRTQRPFSEIVLLHNINYKVEQIFLVDRDSGLLLQHAVAEDAPSASPDMVSAMLTAIQDFVKDSFGVGSEGGLNNLEVGELSIWIERGPSAIVAAVIRGNGPHSIRVQLREVLEKIHLEVPEELEKFSGDTTPFEVFRPDLEACLKAELKDKEKDRGQGAPISRAWAVVALLLVLLLGYWAVTRWQAAARFERFTSLLEAAPGIVVTKAARQGGQVHLVGLRDPLSSDPGRLAEQAGIDPDQVRAEWEPYHALNPELVKRRAEAALQPPDSVTLELEGEVLRAKGNAPSSWIQQADRRAAGIPGVSRLDRQALIDDGQTQLLDRINRVQLRFVEKDNLAPDQSLALGQLAIHLRELHDRTVDSSARIVLHITGLTDEVGTDPANEKVGLSRAGRVLEELRSRGLPETNIEVRLQHRRGSSRSVEFRVDLIKEE